MRLHEEGDDRLIHNTVNEMIVASASTPTRQFRPQKRLAERWEGDEGAILGAENCVIDTQDSMYARRAPFTERLRLDTFISLDGRPGRCTRIKFYTIMHLVDLKGPGTISSLSGYQGYRQIRCTILETNLAVGDVRMTRIESFLLLVSFFIVNEEQTFGCRQTPKLIAVVIGLCGYSMDVDTTTFTRIQ